MTSHNDVARAWSEGRRAEGSRMFTDGRTIWSYGHHFPIATEVGNVILFNTDDYSNSTSRHQSKVRGFCGEVVECTTSEIKQAVDYPNIAQQLPRGRFIRPITTEDKREYITGVIASEFAKVTKDEYPESMIQFEVPIPRDS